MKQNKQPFRTEDGIEAHSDDIYECKNSGTCFPGLVLTTGHRV
jgi:hypothetical protein